MPVCCTHACRGSGNLTYRLKQTGKFISWSCATPDNCRTIISVLVDTKPQNSSVTNKYIAPDGKHRVSLVASTAFTWQNQSHAMRAIAESSLFLTNNVDSDTSVQLTTGAQADLAQPCE